MQDDGYRIIEDKEKKKKGRTNTSQHYFVFLA